MSFRSVFTVFSSLLFLMPAVPAFAEKIYDSIPDPLPPSLTSQSFQAGRISEFGNLASFGGTTRRLASVTVGMVTWGYFSKYNSPDTTNTGGWTSPAVTLNLYSVDASGPSPKPGSLIGSVTQSFFVPWRPEPAPGACSGTMWLAADGCHNGMAFDVTFDFSHSSLTLPDQVIFAIAYDTESAGQSPIGVNGPFNDLNVGLSAAAGTVGSNPIAPLAYLNGTIPGAYADSGAAGINVFRLDTGGTHTNIAAQFNTLSPASVIVTPDTALVQPSGTQKFTATCYDQSGNPISPQPSFGWSVSGGGALNDGLFTAGSTAGGPYTVTASISGTTVSGTASVRVTAPPSPLTSTVALAARLNPSILNRAVSFTATVSGSGNRTPQGAVQFFDGSTLLSTVALVNGTATFSTAALSVGPHGITARYGGGGGYPPAQAVLTQTVNPLPATVSLGASPITAVYGRALTLTAGVGPTAVPPGFAPPSGQVVFSLEGSSPTSPGGPLGTVDLTSGRASLTVGNLPVGTHYLAANYSGDAIWAARSGRVSVTILPASTTTSVSLALVSGKLVLTGVPVPAAPGSGVPTGEVRFVDLSNKTIVATASLSSGKASASFATSAASTVLGRSIAAEYAGDGNFESSTSTPLPVVSNAADYLTSIQAADEIGSIFGVTGLQGDTPATSLSTTSLGGSAVTLTDSAGVSRLAQLYGTFASTGQVNIAVPSGTAAGLASLSISLPSGATIGTVIDIVDSAPGIFTADMTGQGPYAGQVVYAHANGSQTIADSVILNPGGDTFMPNPIKFATSDDQVYLVLYGTGLRHAGTVTATLNGVSVPVAYSGAQGSYPGLDQINLGPLPVSLAGAGLGKLTITIDGRPANPVTLALQ